MDFKDAHKAYVDNLEASLSKVLDMDLAKKRLTYSRWKVSENLDKLLFEFETNVKKNDTGILWCPDSKSSLEQLNKHLKNFNRVEFFKHSAVKYFVNAIDIKIPEPIENPELVVIGAKFIIANTGNFYAVLNSEEEYEKTIKARKVIVIAGIDSVLSLQSELYNAKQLYSIFETGKLNYPAEILGRPGRIRGLNSEVVLLLTDLNKSRLLDIPEHRPLFSLLNFDLPPVCPIQQFNFDPTDWKYSDTIQGSCSAFINGLKENQNQLTDNYGLRHLNRYLPYDLDLYEQILDARALLHAEDKKPGILSIFDKNKSAIVFNSKKFKDKDRFRKYAEHNFFGKLYS